MSTALAPQSPGQQKLATLRGLFDKSKTQIAEVLPKHLTPDRILRVTLAAVARTPLLLQCTEKSILQSVMVAAQLGLDPSGVLGSAYLVPYRNNKAGGQYEAQLIPGYRGLIDLARRSGQVLSVEARLVYKLDKFVCRFGLTTILEHEPFWDGDAGDLRLVYGIARLAGGGEPQVEVMTAGEVAAIRKRSRASESGPWVTDEGEMTRKTVVRRLAKYLPLSPEMESALKLHDDSEMGQRSDYSSLAELPQALADDVETGEASVPTPPDSQTQRVKDKLKNARTSARDAADRAVPESQAPDAGPSLPGVGRASESLVADLRSLLEDRKVSPSDICAQFDVKTLEDLSPEQVAEAIDELT